MAGKEITAAYREQRAARPTIQKITDYTRAFVQGLTGQHADDIKAWFARIGLVPAPGNTPEERYQNTLDWERSQGAAFLAENPVGAIGAEVLGTAPYLLSSAVRGPGAGASIPERVFHGTSLGIGAGAVYGHGAAEGGLLSPERLGRLLKLDEQLAWLVPQRLLQPRQSLR